MKSTKWKITWLPDLPDLVPLTLVDFAHLITKKKVEEDDVFEDLVNPVSVRLCTSAAVKPAALELVTLVDLRTLSSCVPHHREKGRVRRSLRLSPPCVLAGTCSVRH